MSRRARDGFAMLTTLWVMSVASVLAAAAALSGRVTVHAARNRIARDRAAWRASACMARERAAIDDTLASTSSFAEAELRWATLDSTVHPLFDDSAGSCDVAIEAAGARLDVNAASNEALQRLFAANGAVERADSLADALSDWRDSDDVALPAGAERDWYRAHGRKPPSDSALADVAELRLVRGFADVPQLTALLSTDPGRISLANAPAAVLVAVPGITRETAEAIVAKRAGQVALLDLVSVASSLSRASSESLSARYPDAARMTAPVPDAWIVTAFASDGMPRVTASLRVRLVRSGNRAVVARIWSGE